MRPTRSRAAGRLLLSVCLLGAAVVGCSGQEDDSPAQSPQDSQAHPTGEAEASPAPLASRSPRPTATSLRNEEARLDVNRATIDDDGFTVVHWTLTNRSDAPLDFDEYFRDIRVRYTNLAFFNEEYEYPWYLNWTLLAEAIVPSTGKRYSPVTDADANCLCGEWPTRTGSVEELPSGESIRSYSTYYLPHDTQQIDFRIPGFRAESIPLQ